MSNLALTPPKSDLDVAPLLLPAVVLRNDAQALKACLLYTSPSPRDRQKSRMPSSA